MITARDFTIVIPTYRRESVLLDTIESVLALDPPPREIVVVDQTPRHDSATAERLQDISRSKRIRLIHEPTPNLPRARNIGIHSATGRIVLFLDDDVLVRPNFLELHLRHYADDNVAGVSGRIVFPGENPDTPRPLPMSAALAANRLDLQVMRYTTPIPNVLHVVGANMSYRRCWIERVGGFSHRFTGNALAEDVDFAARVRRAGGAIRYDPDAWLVHRATPDGGCRAPSNKSSSAMRAFSTSRARMKNYYFMLAHGVGPCGAIPAIKNRLTPSRVDIDAVASATPSAFRTPSQRIFSAAGRVTGACQGLASGLLAPGGGDLRRAPRRAGPRAAMCTISIVIATYERAGALHTALLSLAAQDEPIEEVIVVDQSRNPTDPSLPALGAIQRIVYTVLSRPSASAARNAGVALARGEVILFVDDDVTVLPDLVRRHRSRYADPRVSAVGGRIAWPGCDPRHASPFPGPRAAMRNHPEAPVCYHATPAVGPLHLITCNFSVRRDWFVAVDGFNERLSGYGEDLEFVARLRRAGALLLYDPRAALVHHSAPVGGIRLSTVNPLRFGFRRGWAHHYSYLRSVGLLGHAAATVRRLTAAIGRYTSASTPSDGPVAQVTRNRGRSAAISYKALALAGSAFAYPLALATYIRDTRHGGDYRRHAEDHRDG